MKTVSAFDYGIKTVALSGMCVQILIGNTNQYRVAKGGLLSNGVQGLWLGYTQKSAATGLVASTHIYTASIGSHNYRVEIGTHGNTVSGSIETLFSMMNEYIKLMG
ncbi:hypothetical protein [Budvicia aquatica]|nr:hypothetical protein [Budvicia aquatica]